MRSLRKDGLSESRRKKLRFFFPLVSLLVFVAGANSCKAASFFSDVLILLGLWFSLFFFGMLIVCFPEWFHIEN